MSSRPTPALFSDIFQVSIQIRKINVDSQKDLRSLKLKRDLFAILCLYQFGMTPEKLLILKFEQFHKLVPKSWLPWLHQFQKELQMPSPWFHSARHESLRPGLSRRSLEFSLKEMATKFHLKNWSVLGLKHAHICKLLQQGLSETQIRINLNLSNHYKFKPFQKYLDQIGSEEIYADIHI